MADCQNGIGPLMCGTSEMDSPLRMQDHRASFFDKKPTGICELHNTSFIASEQVKSILFFEVGNLFAKGRLSNIQSASGLRETQLFSQDNHRVQVPNFDMRKHCSEPRSTVG
jgi:hypothetical protein